MEGVIEEGNKWKYRGFLSPGLVSFSPTIFLAIPIGFWTSVSTSKLISSTKKQTVIVPSLTFRLSARLAG